jgi:hypothetical protein
VVPFHASARVNDTYELLVSQSPTAVQAMVKGQATADRTL